MGNQTIGTIFANFTNWWKKPLNIGGDGWDWLLFVGFVLIAIFLWTRVLREGGHIVGVT
jgi:hypothetical protein